jgi:hypothetical protein
MNWDSDTELAERIAEISPLSADLALEALRSDDETRKLLISLLESHEKNRPVREEIAETKQKLRAIVAA